MAQKKGRGKVPGLSGYYAVFIISSSAKRTGNDWYHIEAKEPGLARIIRLNRGVMDLGAQSDGNFAKGDRRLAHPKADRDGVSLPVNVYPMRPRFLSIGLVQFCEWTSEPPSPFVYSKNEVLNHFRIVATVIHYENRHRHQASLQGRKTACHGSHLGGSLLRR